MDAVDEAIINAFVHSDWNISEPLFCMFDGRLEILSYGGLAVDQDAEGFYSGASIPVNEVLASTFLQLRLSERSGRGVPKIVSQYGKEAIKIEKKRITVTISFQKIDNETHAEVKNKVKININDSQKKIIETMRDNPNVKTVRLMAITGLSGSGVNRNLKKLKELGLIERIGSLKNGYWSVKE